jgi:hypothetical protein
MIHTLSKVLKQLGSHMDTPAFHSYIFSRYKGYDWLHYIRYEPHVACSHLLGDTATRSVLLVGLTPFVVYPLRQIETVRVLDGSVRTVNNKYDVKRLDVKTVIIDNERFLWNGNGNTALLCMMNHSI